MTRGEPVAATRTLRLFTASTTCRSRAHCETCRDPARRAWRESLAKGFRLPASGADFDCPHGVPWGWKPSPQVLAARALQRASAETARRLNFEKRGRELWEKLHTAKDADEAFVRDFGQLIPCGECKREWLAMLVELPPVFGPGWFARSVEWHNRVNARLGKTQMSYEDAAIRWGVAIEHE